MVVLLAFMFNLVFIVTARSECPQNADKIIVCYYSSWSIYREGLGHFNSSHIDPNLCTHLVYTFAGLDLNSKITSLDYSNDIERGSYNSFTKLKEGNPCLKTLLAIGGWNEDSKKYSVMAYTNESRAAFADNVLRYLVTYNFDGLDIDWEYPAERGGIDADRENFVELVKALHERLQIWNLLLTVAVPMSKNIINKSYDIAKLTPYVDYVSLMAYDYTAGDSKTTGLSAPSTVVKEVVEWLLKDLSADKLVLGIATYGRSFTLMNENQNGIGAMTNGSGDAGTYTKEPGFLSYYELQAKLSTKRYRIVPTTFGNYYAYYKKEWLTFDLEDTYIEKVEYAIEKNLRGMMVWTIDTDDFLGLYGETSYPILTTVYNNFLNKS